MSDTIFFSEPRTEEDYQAAIDLLLAEMQRLNKQMESDQAESERLQNEIHLIKAETEVIKARTQARLDALSKMVMRESDYEETSCRR